MNIPRILVDVIVHKFNMDLSYEPIKQNKRNFAPERHLDIEKEVNKLLKACFIREAHYPEWLANIVIIKKSNGKLS